MVRPPEAATAPSELLSIPPLVAAEAEGCQPQLEPPRFLPFRLCFPLAGPEFCEKGFSESLFTEEEAETGGACCPDDFWILAGRCEEPVEDCLLGEARLFPPEEEEA